MDSATNRFLEYWERSVPWVFKEEGLDYAERRRLRYELQDYMEGVIRFAEHRSELVLEIGSGDGIDSAEFGRNGAEVVSLDFTEAGAKATHATLKEAGVTPNVIRASAEDLPFRDSSFNCIYSFGVLHHIPDAPAVVTEISRVLRTGGQVICMVYASTSIVYAYSILFLHRRQGLGEEKLLRMYSERNLNCPYTRAYTKEEACDLFAREFDATASIHYNVIDTPQRRKLKLGVPDSYELGWHIIVRGKRLDSVR